MEAKSLTTERWREYDFSGRVYRINEPQALVVGETTHRVVDKDGTVHCVPAPGRHGCVLRWQNVDITVPVNF